jgi:hypothetical protein
MRIAEEKPSKPSHVPDFPAMPLPPSASGQRSAGEGMKPEIHTANSFGIY